MVVTIASFALYLRTLLPGMAFDDWGEMQTVPHVLGIAHPTGYPTYVLTAWIFELFPVGSVAFRANLLSAVCVALALGLATLAAQRLGVRPAIAAAASLATAGVGTVWGSATVAEVNPLHLLLMALLVERSLAWADGGRLRDFALGGLVVGLALGNHALTVFVAPWLVGFAVWIRRSTLLEHPRWLLAPVVAAIAGLTVYAYIPLAASLHPPLLYNNPVTWDAFRFLVTGEQFRGDYDGLFGSGGPARFVASLPGLADLAIANGSALLPALGLAGGLVLLARRPAAGVALLGTTGTVLYAWANYLELEHYLLVPWLVIGILAGVALDAAASVVVAVSGNDRVGVPAIGARGSALGVRGLATGATGARGLATGAAAALALGLAVVLAIGNFAPEDRSGDHTAEAYADAVFAALPKDAAILTSWGPSSVLWHATLVEGRRPDILVVDDTDIVYGGWGTRERRIASLVCTRPVYISRSSAADLVPTRAEFRLTQVATVVVSAGGPSGVVPIPLYRVDPAGSCAA
jgi:hypothetical protein